MKIIVLCCMLLTLNFIECMQSTLLKSIKLESTLKHIYRVPIDSEHDKGFHCYNVGSFKIRQDSFGNTLCKIKRNLWVYALSSIHDVHVGYVIKNGKVLKNRHSFFPVNSELKMLLQNHIALIKIQTIPWQKDEDGADRVKINFKTKVPGKRKIPFTLKIVLKKTIGGEIICLTAYPTNFEIVEKQSKIALMAHLTSLAEQQQHALGYELAANIDQEAITFHDHYGSYTFLERDSL